MNNPYDTLGVDENATEEEIKKAYRDKSKKQHPDKGGNEEEFKKTTEAYAVLKNPIKREQYDRTGNVDVEDPFANIQTDVSEMFFAIVQQHQRNIDYTDIISEMLTTITKSISLAKNQIPGKDKGIEKLEELLGRIKPKDDSVENFFESIVKGRIKQIESDKLMVNNAIKRFEMMIEFIEQFYCETKEKEKPKPSNTIWSDEKFTFR